jgi:hypothetical protein
MSAFLRELVVKFVFQGDTKKVDGVNKALDQTKAKAKAAGDQVGKFNTQAHSASAGLGNLAGSLRTLVAGYLGFQALSGVARFIGSSNAEFERLNAALVTATGSEAAASAAFGRIEKFAATTPYELGQVTDAFIKLQNLGLEPSEEALTAYGNTASAMGKPLMQMIEAVADAATGEFERLKEFGIRSKKQGDQVTFTFRGVAKTVGINSKEIEQYLTDLGKNQFAGGMARQAKTLAGMMSNLQDNAGRLARKVGSGGLLDALKAAAAEMVTATGNGDSMAESVGKGLGKAIDFVRMNIGWMTKAVGIAGLAFAAWKIGAIAQGLYGLAKSATVASLAAKLMGTSFRGAMMATGIGALIIAVGLLAEDIYQFATGGKSVIGGLTQQFPAFAAAVDGVVAFFRLAAPIVSDFWFGMLESFSAAWAVIGPGLASFASLVMDGIGAAFAWLGPVIGTFFTTAAASVLAFVEFFAGVWQQPSTALSAFWTLVQTLFNQGVAFLTAIAPGIIGAIGGAFQGAYNAAAGWINGIIAKVQGIGPAIMSALAMLPGGSAALGLLGLTPGADASRRGTSAANTSNRSNVTYNGGPISVTTNNPTVARTAVTAGRAAPQLRPAAGF